MLIVTSIVYVLLCGTWGTFYVVIWNIPRSSPSPATWVVVFGVYNISQALWGLVYAYNFYVYLITGKQFRSELYNLFRCCSTSSSAAAAARGDDDDARIARHAQTDSTVWIFFVNNWILSGVPSAILGAPLTVYDQWWRLRPLFTTHEWIFDTRVPWQLRDSYLSSFLLMYTKLNWAFSMTSVSNLYRQ